MYNFVNLKDEEIFSLNYFIYFNKNITIGKIKSTARKIELLLEKGLHIDSFLHLLSKELNYDFKENISKEFLIYSKSHENSQSISSNYNIFHETKIQIILFKLGQYFSYLYKGVQFCNSCEKIFKVEKHFIECDSCKGKK